MKENFFEFAEKYQEAMRGQEEMQKRMFSKDHYIKWLEEFTKKNPIFSDEDLLYHSEQMSQKDQENMSNFNLFYEGIASYAGQNYWYPKENEFGDDYQICYHKIGYKIGSMSGQGTIFFCIRIGNMDEVENPEEFLDFEEILQGKEQKNKAFFDERLQDLKNFIVAMSNEGVPLKAIRDQMETILQELEEK